MTCEQYADLETAERYVAGAMSQGEEVAYEQHFLGCDACLETIRGVEDVRDVLIATRATAASVSPARTPQTLGGNGASNVVAMPLPAASSVGSRAARDVRDLHEARDAREAVAARRDPSFLIVARTNAIRASDMDDALRRGEAYRKAGADVLLLSMARTPEQLRTIGERLGGPLMHLAGRLGLASLGMSLSDLGGLGYKIIADPSTPLTAAFVAWRQVYADLAQGFGAGAAMPSEWEHAEKDLLGVIGLEKLLAIERATVEKGK
jgi:hypothetical protein